MSDLDSHTNPSPSFNFRAVSSEYSGSGPARSDRSGTSSLFLSLSLSEKKKDNNCEVRIIGVWQVTFWWGSNGAAPLELTANMSPLVN